VPFYFRHGPEKHVRRFSGCLTVFANDKAVYSVAFEEDRIIVHPNERIVGEKSPYRSLTGVKE
jgi:hypothetical protein